MDKPNVLTKDEIKKELQHLPGWGFKDDKIFKEYKLPGFMEALRFVNELAPFFEAKDHHPNIHIFYSRILFELQRFHSGDKVTSWDIEVAHEIERHFTETQK